MRASDLVTLWGLGVLLAVGVLLLIRELVCWYWKLNEITRRLADQEEHQAHMAEALDAIADDLALLVEVIAPEPDEGSTEAPEEPSP